MAVVTAGLGLASASADAADAVKFQLKGRLAIVRF
jgi:hypothetical protein